MSHKRGSREERTSDCETKCNQLGTRSESNCQHNKSYADKHNDRAYDRRQQNGVNRDKHKEHDDFAADGHRQRHRTHHYNYNFNDRYDPPPHHLPYVFSTIHLILELMGYSTASAET